MYSSQHIAGPQFPGCPSAPDLIAPSSASERSSHIRPLARADLGGFCRSSSELLRDRQLLDRVDRKFLAPAQKIPDFLKAISADYHLLSAGSDGWASYETCYFDTSDLRSFHEHLRGRRPRYKVRVRHHAARQKSFLEVKRKNAAAKTFKERQARDFGDTELSAGDLAFIARHTPYPLGSLVPSVWTNFRRATLLGVKVNERLTIDLGLTFVRNGQTTSRQTMGIIELKQPRASHHTPAAQALRALGLREASMSKYCAGVSELHEDARPRARRTMQLRLARTF